MPTLVGSFQVYCICTILYYLCWKTGERVLLGLFEVWVLWEYHYTGLVIFIFVSEIFSSSSPMNINLRPSYINNFRSFVSDCIYLSIFSYFVPIICLWDLSQTRNNFHNQSYGPFHTIVHYITYIISCIEYFIIPL